MTAAEQAPSATAGCHVEARSRTLVAFCKTHEQPFLRCVNLDLTSRVESAEQKLSELHAVAAGMPQEIAKLQARRDTARDLLAHADDCVNLALAEPRKRDTDTQLKNIREFLARLRTVLE